MDSHAFEPERRIYIRHCLDALKISSWRIYFQFQLDLVILNLMIVLTTDRLKVYSLLKWMSNQSCLKRVQVLQSLKN